MLYTFSNSPLDLNILCPKEETEVPRGCDWRLVGPVGGGSPLRGPELQWSRSPRLPNVELAPQSELGVLGCRLRVTPGWLSPEAEESKGREGKWRPGLGHHGVSDGPGGSKTPLPTSVAITPHPGHLPQGRYCCS